MKSMLTLSATALAALIKSGELTSKQVVQTHIDRIKKVNPTINAMVKDRFDDAIKEADVADQMIAKGSVENLPPFLGVPCSIKECFAMVGMPNASGLVARKEIIADHDATAVARYKKAGFIPLGVTNTSELCMWMESSNKVYGRTNNPYNPKRIVGGSSGGEGAIVAAAGAPVGLGSDIGGSIRMPSFFNGVFGHKATGGLIPGTGQYPIAVNQALRYLTTGPIVKRAEDLWPLITLLAGPDGQDAQCTKQKLGDPAKVSIDGLKVVIVEGNGAVSVNADILNGIRKAGVALKKMGAKVTTVTVPELKRSLDIWSSMLSAAGGPLFSELMGQGTPISPFGELGKWFVRKSDHTLPGIMLTLMEKAPKYFPERSRVMQEKGVELREKLVEIIGDGVMLYPPYPSVAPQHYKPLLLPFNWQYTAILNVMELPVTQTPLGLNNEGLPLGVQVVGRHGNDHVTVAVAMALEKSMGGWVFPHP